MSGPRGDSVGLIEEALDQKGGLGECFQEEGPIDLVDYQLHELKVEAIEMEGKHGILKRQAMARRS